MSNFIKFVGKQKSLLLTMLAMLVSVFMSANGVLLADVAVVAGGTPTASPGQQGLNTQVPGAATTVSTVEEAGGELIQPEIDADIIKIASDENVLDTIKRRAKRQIQVNSFEVDHYMIDEKRTFGTTTAAVSSGSGNSFAITMSGADAKLFSDYRTVMVQGVKGYAADGSTRTDAFLMLYCIGKNDSGMPKFIAVNGPKAQATDEVCTTPSIAIGSKIVLLGVAGYETQERVSPSVNLPVPERIYLQKQICNNIVSDYFDSQKKRIPFQQAQIAEAAIRDFRLENCRTAWVSVQSKFKVEPQDKNMGNMFVYTTKGVRWQIKRDYQLNGSITLDDIVNLSMFKFTGMNCSKSAIWIMGRVLMADIQKIDLTLHKDISMADSTVFGIKCTKLKTVFGDINLVHDPVLDRIGYEKCGALLDEEGLVRYWRKNETSKSEKVEGEEAKRDIVMTIDALCLKGYSHVWVDGTGLDVATNSKITSAATLPTSPKANDIVILTAAIADSENPETNLWNRGDIVQYNGTIWIAYTGDIQTL